MIFKIRSRQTKLQLLQNRPPLGSQLCILWPLYQSLLSITYFLWRGNQRKKPTRCPCRLMTLSGNQWPQLTLITTRLRDKSHLNQNSWRKYQSQLWSMNSHQLMRWFWNHGHLLIRSCQSLPCALTCPSLPCKTKGVSSHLMMTKRLLIMTNSHLRSISTRRMS